MNEAHPFEGFEIPKQNYCRIPLSLFENLDLFSSMAEMKVVLYILRHTWGFEEYGKAKPLTVDEFMFGRKRKDGTRMDKGTGLSRQSVRNGIDAAKKHGFIEITVDDSDKARVEKSYMLVMKKQGSKIYTPEGKDLDPRGQEVSPRSEIDTSDSEVQAEIPTPEITKPAPKAKPRKQPLQMPTNNKPLDMYTAYKTLILEYLEGKSLDWHIDAYTSNLINLANRMSQKGYTVEDVTNTLRYKIKDRIAPYSFYYLEKDIPAYRSQQLTMHNTDAYKEFVAPPIPVITEEQKQAALQALANSKAERAKESAA